MTLARSLLAFFICTAAGAARADPLSPECINADTLLDQGVAARQAGHDAEGLALFEQAQAKCPTPRATAEIALAEATLERWLDADMHLRAALQSPDPWIATKREALERARAVIEKHLGHLRLTGGVESVAQGQAANIEIPPPPPLPPPTRVPRLRIAGGIGLGVAALAFGGAIAATVIRNQRANHWNDDGACVYSDVSKSRLENCGSDWDAIHLTQSLSTAGYAVGGALAVTSVVLIVLSVKPKKSEAKVTWNCGAGPGELAVACTGTF